MTPAKNVLRREIGWALAIKIILLAALWFLVFRWQDRPAKPPDIAAHFALPGSAADFSSQPHKELNHDR